MSIAPTAVQETWKPILQHVAVARPSGLGMVSSSSAVEEVVAVASVLAAIPVPMAAVASEVTLVAEAREIELPALLGRGSRGSPLPSKPKEPREDVAKLGSGHLVVA